MEHIECGLGGERSGESAFEESPTVILTGLPPEGEDNE